MKEWIVDHRGRGDFATIGEALPAAEAWSALAPEPYGKGARIQVRAGLYREKLKVMVPGIELSGEGADDTRIVWDDCASRLLPTGERMSTFNSYTAYVGASCVTLRGLSILNTAGDGRLVGQAVALYADADLFIAEDCRLSARQDKLCTDPLAEPPGAAQQASGNLTGAVQDIAINPDGGPGGTAQGGITAPSTYPGQSIGFLFSGCRLTAEAGADRVFLGRPWRHTGRTVFDGCHIGAHIAPEGWDDWAKPEAREFGGFAEYGSRGPGAPRMPASMEAPSGSGASRVTWATTITAAGAAAEASSAARSARTLFGQAFAGR